MSESACDENPWLELSNFRGLMFLSKKRAIVGFIYGFRVAFRI